MSGLRGRVGPAYRRNLRLFDFRIHLHDHLNPTLVSHASREDISDGGRERLLVLFARIHARYTR
jgi:hypothetical protein